MPRRIPSQRSLNAELSEATGQDVVQFEVLPLAIGDTITVTFESVNSDWRQGVWLGTEGELDAAGERSSQLLLWADTAPPQAVVTCLRTDGLLRLHNIWDSGRRPGFESLSHTSGMLVEMLPSGGRRYRCTDIGHEPTFETLVFTITRQPSGSDVS